MKIVFLSNYLNHHQLPLCLAWHRMKNVEFSFVATTPVPSSRISLGYADMNSMYDFVVRGYENEGQQEIIQRLCMEADIVITGSAPWRYIKPRLKQHKLTFRYSERLFRIKPPFYEIPLRAIKYYFNSGRHRSLYLLCASAFTAADFAKTGTFLGKAYKWGYFPAVHRYDDLDSLMNAKQPMSILWAARFLKLKHPEHVIEVAKRLKAEGYKFVVNMLGNGAEQNSVAQMIQDYGLQENVILHGATSPEEVRTYMEQSQIYLFTSDRNEGWGAVLNESMNSGCAVVASDAIGAVPFLMRNKQNGLIYRSGDVEDLCQKVKYLLDNPIECVRMGTNAYTTMTDEWNAETAAERLVMLSGKLLQGEKHPYPYTDGPCSKAEILKG